jgi:hypothetical protein
VINLQPKSGGWKLNIQADHLDTCLGLPAPADGAAAQRPRRFCKSAFTAAQVARAVQAEAAADPNITTHQIKALVEAKGIFARLPSGRFFGDVKQALKAEMGARRDVNMAALEGYAELLRLCGHDVTAHCPASPTWGLPLSRFVLCLSISVLLCCYHRPHPPHTRLASISVVLFVVVTALTSIRLMLPSSLGAK